VRFRAHLMPRRVILLVVGSVPGAALGSWTLANASPDSIKRAIGLFVMLATVALARVSSRPAPRPIPGAPLLAGMLGGFCGATSSLSGVPPAILLARDRVAPRSFQADLALYFLCSNFLTLALLAWRGGLATGALFPAVALWLPGALAGNLAGVWFSARLPDQAFRRLTLLVAFLAGLVTAATA
jgi:uncharacterized protein